MSSRDLILQKAIELFNELGTARISTNHIAREAGISPGNLYYHFSDKAHIIREIFELMAADWDRINENSVNPEKPFPDFMKDFIHANFELLWRYRFYSREMTSLINSDPVLYQRHVPVINRHFDQQVRIVQEAVKAGNLRFPDPAFQAQDAMMISWVVSNQYLNHLEGMGIKVGKRDFDDGVNLILNTLRPYIVE